MGTPGPGRGRWKERITGLCCDKVQIVGKGGSRDRRAVGLFCVCVCVYVCVWCVCRVGVSGVRGAACVRWVGGEEGW